MKSSVVFIAIFLILVNMACKKESGQPVRRTNVARQLANDSTGTSVIGTLVKDTTSTLQEINSPGEMIFGDLVWIFPWFSTVEVKDFNRMIPGGTIFKVFIKRGGSTDWIEVPSFGTDADATSKYDYFVEKRPDGAGIYNFGSLYIFYYGTDVEDHPSVKVTY